MTALGGDKGQAGSSLHEAYHPVSPPLSPRVKPGLSGLWVGGRLYSRLSISSALFLCLLVGNQLLLEWRKTPSQGLNDLKLHPPLCLHCHRGPNHHHLFAWMATNSLYMALLPFLPPTYLILHSPTSLLLRRMHLTMGLLFRPQSCSSPPFRSRWWLWSQQPRLEQNQALLLVGCMTLGKPLASTMLLFPAKWGCLW